MSKISTYPISQPTINDILIGSDVDNINMTKNFLLEDILELVPTTYNTGVPTVVTASPGGSSTIPTASLSGATVNIYSCTWSGGNGSYTLTLPSAVTDAYRAIRVITDGTFLNNTLQVILTPILGQTINGVASATINKQYTGILVWSDGSNWRVIQEIS